jgi:hypothetical protein
LLPKSSFLQPAPLEPTVSAVTVTVAALAKLAVNTTISAIAANHKTVV